MQVYPVYPSSPVPKWVRGFLVALAVSFFALCLAITAVVVSRHRAEEAAAEQAAAQAKAALVTPPATPAPPTVMETPAAPPKAAAQAPRTARAKAHGVASPRRPGAVARPATKSGKRHKPDELDRLLGL